MSCPKHRDAWPQDWEDPKPTELNIPGFAWRKHYGKDNTYVYTFGVTIPISREGGRDAGSFEFTISAKDAKTDNLLCQSKRFLFPTMEEYRGPISIDWVDGINPDYVKDHPIGPQLKHLDIEKRISPVPRLP